MQQEAIRCFIRHMNCILGISNVVVPELTSLLSIFDGRCPVVFCPVIEQPEICDLELARYHFKQFEEEIKDGGDACG